MAEAQIEITQVRSLIGRVESQRATMRSLGLRRIRQTVTMPDRLEIRGMVAKVAHLVEVRYPGDADILGLQSGQEPKGQGNAPAGPSVADEDSTAQAQALSEIRAEEQSTPLGDLVQNPDTLSSVENPARPKASGGTPIDDAEEETPVSDLLNPDVDTQDKTS